VSSPGGVGAPFHRAAAVTTLVIAAVYGLIFAGVVSVGRAEAGELGILGVAGGVHLVLAAGLWVWPRRLLLAGTAVLQVLLGAMYLAIAPERDPSYEVWGLTIRALSVLLVILLVAAFAQNPWARRGK
jgi:hypothetical protein